MDRRVFLKAGAALPFAATLPPFALAQQTEFDPKPGEWRTFEITTRVDVQKASGTTRVWLPIPAVDSDWQQTLANNWSTNASTARMISDGKYGADMLYAEFAANESAPVVELTSRLRTQSRATAWGRKVSAKEDAETLKFWLASTELMPTDGIVRKTAQDATRGRRTDLEKVQGLYAWVVSNTYREPKVRGCGTGDIKAMLETGNMGGKCGDINALFVGLCRSVGVPARDVYGIRLAPSAFGYKALSGNSANLTRAQHCRAEVFLKEYGWVAMDPADVGKVMREETSEWIKTSAHPLVTPVNAKLFGGWEGNWLAFNTAHDVALPSSSGARLAFFMYPQCETGGARLDPLDPDNFKYTIKSSEIKLS